MLFEEVRSIWLPRTPVYYAVNGFSAILGLLCSLHSGIGIGAFVAWLACVATFAGLRRAEEKFLHLSKDDVDDRRASVPLAFQSAAAPTICVGAWAALRVVQLFSHFQNPRSQH